MNASPAAYNLNLQMYNINHSLINMFYEKILKLAGAFFIFEPLLNY